MHISFNAVVLWTSAEGVPALATIWTSITSFIMSSNHCCHPLLVCILCPSIPHSPILHRMSCLTDFFFNYYYYYHYFLNSLFFFLRFLTLVSWVVSLRPLSPPSCFSHVCCLSLFSPSFSVFLSLPLLCWSLWLILKGSRESEWDLKEREELRSTQQGRPSLDWNAARKEKKKKNEQHTGEESFSLSLLFSFLHHSTLLFHHSWVVWYLTFTLLQLGLGSKSSERKLVSPQSYGVIPLFLFPLPLSLSYCYFFFPCLQTDDHCNIFCLTERQGEKKKMLKYPDRHPHFYQ